MAQVNIAKATAPVVIPETKAKPVYAEIPAFPERRRMDVGQLAVYLLVIGLLIGMALISHSGSSVRVNGRAVEGDVQVEYDGTVQADVKQVGPVTTIVITRREP